MIDVVEQLEEITNNSSKIGFTEVAASVSVLETAAEFANTIAGNAMVKYYFLMSVLSRWSTCFS